MTVALIKLYIDWFLTYWIQRINVTFSIGINFKYFSCTVCAEYPEILIIHQQRAVCVHLSPLLSKSDLSLELWNYSGVLNQDIPSILWQSSACLFCLPLYPTSVLTAPFYVQQSSGSSVYPAWQTKVLESNKPTATVMIVTPLKCDCVPKLDWTAAAFQTSD